MLQLLGVKKIQQLKENLLIPVAIALGHEIFRYRWAIDPL